ncbi:MAG: inorganic phosphate transporter, partial [Acidobacteria bacterium]|nr:inorganic phosphate transporter [Acidobacteriota bacterium]
GPATNYVLIAAMMALGGLVAAKSVANTMARRVTQLEPAAGMSANLTGALLVTAASRWGLPVSTTHVTMGAIFGVGVHRREQAHWTLVRQIVLAWIITLPLGLMGGLLFYGLLRILI